MSLTTRFTPVNGYDIQGLTLWLEQMAAQGLRYVYSFGPFTQFRKVEPTCVHIHLEPARQGTEEEAKELADLYTTEGWEFWNCFKNNFYVFATENPDASAHTEPELLSYALSRLTRRLRFKLFGVLAAFLLLFYLFFDRISSWWFWYEFRAAPLYSFATNSLSLWMLPVLLALIFLMVSTLRGLSPLYRMSHALRYGHTPDQAPKKLRGGGWLKAACLCLLLIPLFWLFQSHGKDSVALEDLNESCGYVLLEELESQPGFSTQSLFSRDYGASSWHPLTPQKYYSQQWGDYHRKYQTQTLENGGTMTTSSSRYYLSTHIFHCLTPGIAERIFQEQDHWAYFQDGTEMDYPGFDRLIIHQEPAGGSLPDDQEISINDAPLDLKSNLSHMTRWNLYGLKGQNVLLVEYRGQADLMEFLPRFAQMLEHL